MFDSNTLLQILYLHGNNLLEVDANLFIHLATLKELAITLAFPVFKLNNAVFSVLPVSCILHIVGGQISCSDIDFEGHCIKY